MTVVRKFISGQPSAPKTKTQKSEIITFARGLRPLADSELLHLFSSQTTQRATIRFISRNAAKALWETICMKCKKKLKRRIIRILKNNRSYLQVKQLRSKSATGQGIKRAP